MSEQTFVHVPIRFYLWLSQNTLFKDVTLRPKYDLKRMFLGWHVLLGKYIPKLQKCKCLTKIGPIWTSEHVNKKQLTNDFYQLSSQPRFIKIIRVSSLYKIKLGYRAASNFNLTFNTFLDERIGSIFIVAKDSEMKCLVEGNINPLIRGLYLTISAPANRIVTKLWTEPELKKQW